ncbi:MAG: glycosyltransferase [Methanobacteriota archaeon]
MRVLMIVSNDVVHDSRVLKEARALDAAGHTVTCIGWDRSGTLPPSEQHNGIEIRRVRTDGGMRLLWKDLFRNPVWWRRARRLASQIPFDVVHCHDLDTLPVGVRLKEATGKPLVYDCHEVFGYMIEADVPRAVVEYAFRLERRLAPHADRVVAANEMVKEYVDTTTRAPAVVVRNCSEEVLDVYRAPPGRPFTILYLGTLHPSRFILPAIEAMADLPDARLLIGGSKKLAPQVEAACARSKNATFLGLVPSDRVQPMTVEADVVLCMFDPTHRINHVGLRTKYYKRMPPAHPS